jgi:hypothetical protein
MSRPSSTLSATNPSHHESPFEQVHEHEDSEAKRLEKEQKTADKRRTEEQERLKRQEERTLSELSSSHSTDLHSFETKEEARIEHEIPRDAASQIATLEHAWEEKNEAVLSDVLHTLSSSSEYFFT